MPQSRILYNGSRNDYPAFWNRFCQKLSEEGIYYVIEPNYQRLIREQKVQLVKSYVLLPKYLDFG
jgi:hypothetical protein